MKTMMTAKRPLGKINATKNTVVIVFINHAGK
jgi:hypothetical protein